MNIVPMILYYCPYDPILLVVKHIVLGWVMSCCVEHQYQQYNQLSTCLPMGIEIVPGCTEVLKGGTISMHTHRRLDDNFMSGLKTKSFNYFYTFLCLVLFNLVLFCIWHILPCVTIKQMKNSCENNIAK